MEYLNSREKDLEIKSSVIFILIFALFFVCFEAVLLTRHSSERYLSLSSDYLEKSSSIPKDEIIERALLYQKALRILNSSVSSNPANPKAYFEYAEVVGEIARDPEVRAALGGKILRGEDDSLDGFYNLQKKKIIEAISKEPANAIYHLKLGSVYNNLGDKDKAEKEFSAALYLDPKNMSIHLYLSRYFLSKGQEAEFLYHINKAIELGGENEAAQFLKKIGRQDLILK